MSPNMRTMRQDKEGTETVMFDKQTLEIVKRLQKARISLMKKQPFYAVLLLNIQFSLDTSCETAYTDGTRIAFCPDFIKKLSDSELEFVLMHEVLHAALNHCNRKLDSYDFDAFNTACDIVVNSNILYSFNMDLSVITLKNYGESMHLAPDGKEGYLYTVEEVYKMVRLDNLKKETKPSEDRSSANKDTQKTNDSKGQQISDDNDQLQARRDGGFDDHTFWGLDDDNFEDQEEQDGDFEDQDGQDGFSAGQSVADTQNGDPQDGGKDYLSKGAGNKNDDMQQQWLSRMIEATQIAHRMSVGEQGKSPGKIPLCAERTVKEFTEPQTDWRTVLDTFVQEEITDYSFNPPDRRMQDSPFLLPDYNEKEDTVKDILFMIDTSASMSDDMITQAYSEINGAIMQFGGKLQGWLGFFDANVVKPQEFSDEEEFKIIRPQGGGGTNFQCIFDYVQENINEITPASIIILTDGYAPFPKEEEAMDIPVLWLINNEQETPPWGKVTRIKAEDKGE